MKKTEVRDLIIKNVVDKNDNVSYSTKATATHIFLTMQKHIQCLVYIQKNHVCIGEITQDTEHEIITHDIDKMYISASLKNRHDEFSCTALLPTVTEEDMQTVYAFLQSVIDRRNRPKADTESNKEAMKETIKKESHKPTAKKPTTKKAVTKTVKPTEAHALQKKQTVQK